MESSDIAFIIFGILFLSPLLIFIVWLVGAMIVEMLADWRDRWNANRKA